MILIVVSESQFSHLKLMGSYLFLLSASITYSGINIRPSDATLLASTENVSSLFAHDIFLGYSRFTPEINSALGFISQKKILYAPSS